MYNMRLLSVFIGDGIAWLIPQHHLNNSSVESMSGI